MSLQGELAFVCDNMPAARKLLSCHYPSVPNLGDVTEVNWKDIPEVDILTAGVPCQPVSLAGRGLGEKDPRWLWPELYRAVRVLGPRYVLMENVRGLVDRGLRGILGELANLGYDARWCCIRASDAGAPHKRERIFVLAHLAHSQHDGFPCSQEPREGSGTQPREWSQRRAAEEPARSGSQRAETAADPYGQCREIPGQYDDEKGPVGSQGLTPRSGPASPHPERQGRERQAGEEMRGDVREAVQQSAEVDWGAFEPAIRRWELIMGRPAPVPLVPLERKSRNHANPRKEHLNPALPEWMLGFPEGWITDVPGLTYHDQCRLAGNACVPQQVALALDILA